MNEKIKQFKKTLNSDLISIKELKDISWGGIPDKYRDKAWLYLLEIISVRKDDFERDIVVLKESFYLKILRTGGTIQSLFESLSDLHENCKDLNHHNINNTNTNIPGNNFTINSSLHDESKNDQMSMILADEKPIFKIKDENKMIKQIKTDIRRLEYYACEGDSFLQNTFILILLLVAERNPLVGYIQGMADLLQPFMMLYSDIAIIYMAYSRFIDTICENLVESQTCIYVQIEKIEHILSLVEPDLYKHLDSINLMFYNFVFRWLSCFFFREFPLPMYLKILDTYFSASFYKKFPIYLSVAILSFFKNSILGKDFADALIFIQNCKKMWNDEDLEILFSKVFVYNEIFSESYLFRKQYK